MDGNTQEAAENEMQRIVEVEEPLHAFGFAAGAVVLAKQGDGEGDSHLKESVYRVDEEDIDGGVHGHTAKHVCHLFPEITPVLSVIHNDENGDAAPVGAEGDDADNGERQGFHPGLQPGAFALKHGQSHQSPGQ